MIRNLALNTYIIKTHSFLGAGVRFRKIAKSDY